MFSQINEQIEVLAHFSKKSLKPIYFTWKNQNYNINSIDFIHHSKEGSAKLWHFSVSTLTDNYKLTFNANTLMWTLKEIYSTKIEYANALNDKKRSSRTNNFTY